MWTLNERRRDLVTLTLDGIAVPNVLAGEGYEVSHRNQAGSQLMVVNLSFPMDVVVSAVGKIQVPFENRKPCQMPQRLISEVESGQVFCQQGSGGKKEAIRIFTDLRGAIGNARLLSPKQLIEKPGVLSWPH